MTAEVESLQKLILATMNEDAGFSYGKNPLSLSEEIATLITELKKGVCLFQFRKKDGQTRRAAGTLSQEVIDRYREELDTYVPKTYRKKARPTSRALKKVLLTKDSQIYTNEGCSRFFDILHFF